MSQTSKQNARTHTVRPRWTWIGLVVMAAGLVLIGIGIIVTSWAWTVPGIFVLGCGGVASVYGGFFYDVQGGASPSTQLRDVVEDNEFEFPGAGTRHSESEVKEDVHRRWLSDDE